MRRVGGSEEGGEEKGREVVGGRRGTRVAYWNGMMVTIQRNYGQVAQSVERSPEKAGVGGSIPSLATTF